MSGLVACSTVLPHTMWNLEGVIFTELEGVMERMKRLGREKEVDIVSWHRGNSVRSHKQGVRGILTLPGLEQNLQGQGLWGKVRTGGLTIENLGHSC